VLEAVPRSRLLVKCHSFVDDDCADAFAARAGKLGIEPGRLLLVGATSHVGVLETFADIDVSLDPFPHGGAISTAESLCMGVPVVNLHGRTPMGRVTTSILRANGLSSWVAESEDQYVQIATAAAADPAQLNEFRQHLRARVSASPFGDAETYTRRVEDAYRAMWMAWCERVRSATRA
jgi:predicted O-linked N-acetylglucosamine transferase (SPINDLY family)